MDLKLKIVQGSNAGQEVAVTWQTFLIGRAEDCHLRPGSEMVSRHHCAIVVDQAYVAVRDFGSKNGTYVNDERVAGECELKSGDQLRLGPLVFEVALRQGELGGKKKPPVLSPKEAAQRTAAGNHEDLDVARFLDDPTETPLAVDTQSIRLKETEQIALARPPGGPIIAQLRSPAANTAPPAAAPPTGTPLVATPLVAAPPPSVARRALPSIFQMPVSEPETPASTAADQSGRLDKKKVFGKLPTHSKRPEDTRSAAVDLLDKMRKRR